MGDTPKTVDQFSGNNEGVEWAIEIYETETKEYYAVCTVGEGCAVSPMGARDIVQDLAFQAVAGGLSMAVTHAS